MKLSSVAPVALLILATAACSSAGPVEEEQGGSQADLSTAEANQIFGGLDFLDHAERADVLSAEETRSAASRIDALALDEEALGAWLGGLSQASDHAVRVSLPNGRSALFVTRQWSAQGGKGNGYASLNVVIKPDGSRLAYAERLRVTPAVQASLSKIEGGKMVPVLRQNASSSTDTGVSTAAFDFGTALHPQGFSRTTRSRLCTTCSMTLQAAKFVGPAFLALAGTGGASAICTRLGITSAVATAETGPGALLAGGGTWIACNLAFYALGVVFSAAALIDGEDGRKNKCSDVSDSIGLGRVCEGLAPEQCSSTTIAASVSPVAKCEKMGQCARAFHCKFDGNQLCPSLDISGANADLCREVISRTCANPIGLTDDTDFAEPCQFLAQKFPPKANP